MKKVGEKAELGTLALRTKVSQLSDVQQGGVGSTAL